MKTHFKAHRTRSLLAAALLVVGLVALWWITVRDRGLIEVPITLSEKRVPVIEARVAGMRAACELRLSSKYPLYLAPDALAELPKDARGEGDWKNAQGLERRAPLFAVPSVAIGALNLGTTLTAALPSEAPEAREAITWPLEKMNLALDLPRRTAWGVKRAQDLKRLGFDPSQMERVKCQITRKGIYFTSSDGSREFKTVLSTGANYNLINASVWDGGQSGADLLSTPLKIGEREVGPLQLYPYAFASELEVEIVLGIDFLQAHVVYIDARNESLYIGDRCANALPDGSKVRAQLLFLEDGRPVVDIKMGKQRAKALIDLGSCHDLLLRTPQPPSHTLRRLFGKTLLNFRGVETDASCFLLPSCRIGAMNLKNLILTIGAPTDNSVDLRSDDNYGELRSYDVSLGHPLLQRANLFFDWPHSLLWFAGPQEHLSQIGMDPCHYQALRFEMVKVGLVVAVDSDLGSLKCLIDTGTSGTFVKPARASEAHLESDELGNPCIISNTFILGAHDYGRQILYPIEISPRLGDFDAILGIDFLMHHRLYIDYQNQLIYLEKPCSVLENTEIGKEDQ